MCVRARPAMQIATQVSGEATGSPHPFHPASVALCLAHRAPNLRDHLLREQRHGRGLRVVRAPRVEAGAAQPDVFDDALGDLLRRADQVAAAPGVELLAERAAAAAVDDLLLGLPDVNLR